MKHMTKRRRIGMIDLSADEFSQSCLPYPTAVIRSISNKLPVVAKKKNDDLLTIIKVTRTTNHLLVKLVITASCKVGTI